MIGLFQQTKRMHLSVLGMLLLVISCSVKPEPLYGLMKEFFQNGGKHANGMIGVSMRAKGWSFGQRVKHLYNYKLLVNTIQSVESYRWLGFIGPRLLFILNSLPVERLLLSRVDKLWFSDNSQSPKNFIMTIGKIISMSLDLLIEEANFFCKPRALRGYSHDTELFCDLQKYASRVFAPGISEGDRKEQFSFLKALIEKKRERLLYISEHILAGRSKWLMLVTAYGVTGFVEGMINGCVEVLLNDEENRSIFNEIKCSIAQYVITTITSSVPRILKFKWEEKVILLDPTIMFWRTKERCLCGIERLARIEKELARFADTGAPSDNGS